MAAMQQSREPEEWRLVEFVVACDEPVGNKESKAKGRKIQVLINH